jgi:hyperosmotically inducible protein
MERGAGMLLKKLGLPLLMAVAVIMLPAAVGIALPVPAHGAGALNASRSVGGLEDEIRHQLLMLPYYGVFDNLEFEVQEDGTVVLSGQAMRPTLKSDAEHVVRRLPGVGEIINRVEVLPFSRFDDQIRVAVYRALFSSTQLDRYAMGAIPAIHIIVKNGNVTLIGAVATQMDKNVAGIIANGVPGTFSLTNNLTVERKG